MKNQLTGEWGPVPNTARYYKVGTKLPMTRIPQFLDKALQVQYNLNYKISIQYYVSNLSLKSLL